MRKMEALLKYPVVFFETYKNELRLRGHHIYNTATYMVMAKMFPYTYKHHLIPHYKCVLRCYDKFPSIVLTSQEENKDTTNMCGTIIFHVYRNVSCCNAHSQRPYQERRTCSLCYTVPISDRNAKLYTWKELMLLEILVT